MDINVLLPFNKEQKCTNWSKITLITLFYPLFDAQFVKNQKQLALVHAI